VAEELHDLLRGIEGERLRLLGAADVEAAAALHADDYQLITPTGTPLTKAEYLDAIGTGQLRYLAFEPVSEIAVRGSEQALILRYRAHITVVSDGGRGDLECWHTDYYELRSAGWQAVWSQATRIEPRD
jgi:Domain of unknown function (DUF4440)